MKLCVSQKQMQELEQHSIERVGIPSIVLMERAALAVVDCICQHVDKLEHISIVCGKGNNGADGVAVARILFQRGYHVSIVAIGDVKKATKEYKVQSEIAEKLGILSCSWEAWTVNANEWIVDGIFGIGLKRDIGGDYAALIEKIKEGHCEKVIAIDIPSGISADTGKVLGCALKAQYTVTFGYGKIGLYLQEGRAYAGEVQIAEIGFAQESIDKAEGPKIKIIEEEDLSTIPKRDEDGNKGTFGKLLVVAGSRGMSGASYLCAMAAYRMGAGLVQILTVEENRAILQMQLPEAIVQGYTEANRDACIKRACDWATVIVMGPGLGQELYVKDLVEKVLYESKIREKSCPLVLDSDALNMIAIYPELRKYYGEHIIITPHMKEMSRLVGETVQELKGAPMMYGRAYSKKHQVTCVLKDAVSMITNYEEEQYFTTSGNSALAKGGTGDILAGMIGGLLCLGMQPLDAAAYGSYLHGRAGKYASKEKGKHGVMASELVDFIKYE